MLEYLAMQNIRTKVGIEARAKEFIEKNPRRFVSADKEPIKLFNKKEISIYGEEYLKPVVARIYELLLADGRRLPDTRLLHFLTKDQASLRQDIQRSHAPRLTPDEVSLGRAFRQPSVRLREPLFTPQDARSSEVLSTSRLGTPCTSVRNEVTRENYRKLWLGGLPHSFTLEAVYKLLEKWCHSVVEVGIIRGLKWSSVVTPLHVTIT